MQQPYINVNKKPNLDDLKKPNPLQLQQVETSDRGSCHQSQSHTPCRSVSKVNFLFRFFPLLKNYFRKKYGHGRVQTFFDL